MAIQISGNTVIDNSRNINAGIGTFTSLDVPPAPLTFNPADGAVDVSLSTTIVITFNQIVVAGSGNITIREGSAGGTVLQTIAASSGSVAISGGQVTISPSAFPTNKTIYVVVEDDAFFGYTNTTNGNTEINTYNFNTVYIPALGESFEGGFLICQSAGIRWIVAPSSAEVIRSWYSRDESNTVAQQVSGCTGWFVPTCTQIKNPGFSCRVYWDSWGASGTCYWSSTSCNTTQAWAVSMCSGTGAFLTKASGRPIRSFRCVSY